MDTLYKLHYDCGRMGSLDGLFIASKGDLDELVESKREVYFGEVLGKHSEIYGPIEASDVTEVSTNPEVIGVIRDNELQSGYNPFDYIQDED